jgi:hypothetical protein
MNLAIFIVLRIDHHFTSEEVKSVSLHDHKAQCERYLKISIPLINPVFQEHHQFIFRGLTELVFILFIASHVKVKIFPYRLEI